MQGSAEVTAESKSNRDCYILHDVQQEATRLFVSSQFIFMSSERFPWILMHRRDRISSSRAVDPVPEEIDQDGSESPTCHFSDDTSLDVVDMRWDLSSF
jgi:hypothetical protein